MSVARLYDLGIAIYSWWPQIRLAQANFAASTASNHLPVDVGRTDCRIHSRDVTKFVELQIYCGMS